MLRCGIPHATNGFQQVTVVCEGMTFWFDAKGCFVAVHAF